MGQGALSKPAVQWWLSLNSSTSASGRETELWVGCCLSTLYLALHGGRQDFWCWRVLANSVTVQAGSEREIFLFDGPGGAMGIDFFVGAGTYFSRVSAKKIFFGDFWCFCVCFGFFFLKVLLCFCAFSSFFSRVGAKKMVFFGGAVSKTGNSRSGRVCD